MKSLIWVLAVLICLGAGEAWGQWHDPVLIDSPYDTVGININQREWCPFITADGQYFYFASERSQVNNDIYVCHWTGLTWSRPLMLPFCQLLVDERQPAVNPTNDTLYFISYDGTGGWDIFWSFRDGPCDTCWGQPQRMPEPINSIGGIEFSVWPTPDNQRLLFSSWRIAANNEDINDHGPPQSDGNILTCVMLNPFIDPYMHSGMTDDNWSFWEQRFGYTTYNQWGYAPDNMGPDHIGCEAQKKYRPRP